MTQYEQMKKRHLLEELMMIEKTLIETKGNRTQAAEIIGITLRKLRHKLKLMQGEEYHDYCKWDKVKKERKEKNLEINTGNVKNTISLAQVEKLMYNDNVSFETMRETRRILDKEKGEKIEIENLPLDIRRMI